MSETDLHDVWFDYSITFVEKKNHLGWDGLAPQEQEIAALWLLEADVYNGGFLQFFCNWGEEAYNYALRALRAIGATHALDIIQSGYACIEHFSQDQRLEELWDIPKFLTEEEEELLDQLDQKFWDDQDHIAEVAYQYYARQLGE